MTDDYNYDYNALHGSDIFSIVFGSICILFPLSVIIILLLRYEQLLKDKDLVHYIFFIALADTMTALTIAMGYPPSNSDTCVAQGFLFIFFSRASWLLTNVLVFSLCCLIIKGKFLLSRTQAHAIIWVVNLILQFVPYMYQADVYGSPQDDNADIPITRCFFTYAEISEHNLELYLFRNVIISAFVFNAVAALFVIIYSKLYIEEGHPLKNLWRVVLLYPLAMFLAWFPTVIYDSYRFNYVHNSIPYHADIVSDYLESFVGIYGVLLCLIFYMKTDQARVEWYRLYYNLFHSTTYDIRSSDTSSKFRDSSMAEVSKRSSLVQLTEPIINPIEEGRNTI